MAIGPVQLIVLGFKHPEFHGEIIAELERLHDDDTVRVIDALAVHKDADGEVEVQHLSNLSKEQAIEVGSAGRDRVPLGRGGQRTARPRNRRTDQLTRQPLEATDVCMSQNGAPHVPARSAPTLEERAWSRPS